MECLFEWMQCMNKTGHWTNTVSFHHCMFAKHYLLQSWKSKTDRRVFEVGHGNSKQIEILTFGLSILGKDHWSSNVELQLWNVEGVIWATCGGDLYSSLKSLFKTPNKRSILFVVFRPSKGFWLSSKLFATVMPTFEEVVFEWKGCFMSSNIAPFGCSL